jgi:2-polyprenyl-3-methyl-5-hydroxy-6-metoxy-1,4-benzoquinol methylase
VKGLGIAVNHTDRRHTQTEHEYAATDLETMQEARRYGDHLFNLFRGHIGKRVLEIGCGIGTMSQRLLDVADEVVAMEPNRYCASRTRELLGAHPRFTMHECLLEECDPSELASHRFDTVYCSNVLEHIEDDAAALRTFRDVIVPGGKVLIFVPAIPAAYGPLDAELGHHRRYTKATLGRAFREAGLPLLTLRYTNPIGLAGWMFNAHVTKSTAHSLTQVKIFDNLIAPWALPLESLIPPPLGLSLVAVGQKQ